MAYFQKSENFEEGGQNSLHGKALEHSTAPTGQWTFLEHTSTLSIGFSSNEIGSV